jgi:integrase|tara:strand:- start:1640 stop:2566 length:927 start_codon:yes stop_codon:yes gene_type:complete
MNLLRQTLREYVVLRRGLGHKFTQPARDLEGFVTFMDKRDSTFITTKLALEWATQSQGKNASWAIKLAYVRGFARHVQALEIRTEVPPVGLLPYSGSAKPYIYSDIEIQALLEAALALKPANKLRRWTYHCLFGLLPVTGLRISEALTLKRQDVDLEHGILTVRDTKFGKSRYVPIHESTQRILVEYDHRRNELVNPPCSEYFLVAERGGRLLPQYVYPVFLRLSRQIGLRAQSANSGPRLHDFRHTFAVNTLLRWYRTGEKVDTLLPKLSTYLGHSCVRDTYWYLSACPELMELAAQRLETRWESKL